MAFFNRMQQILADGTRGLGVTEAERNMASEMIRSLALEPQFEIGDDGEETETVMRYNARFDTDDDTPNILALGNHYFPLGVLYASYLIYYDHSIRNASRYPDSKYRLMLEVAGADDGLLSALRGIFTRKFSAPLAGFPVTVNSYTGDYSITYYTTFEVEDRLRLIDQQLATTALSLENEYGRYSLRELLNFDQETFIEYFDPIYRARYGKAPYEGIEFTIPGATVERAREDFWNKFRNSFTAALNMLSHDYLLVRPSRFTPAFYFTQLTEALTNIAANPPNVNSSYGGLRWNTLPENPTYEQYSYRNITMDASAFLACGLASPGTITLDQYVLPDGRVIDDYTYDSRHDGITCAGAPGFYFNAIPLAETLESLRTEKKILEKLITTDE